MYIVTGVVGQIKWQWFGKVHKLKDFQRIDDASRGPWGSMKLLCRMRGPVLALLGAFTSVIALTIDPFTQNIIAVRNCQIPSTNQTAFIPTADHYDNTLGSMPGITNPKPGDFTLWGKFRFLLEPAIKASVYSGLYGYSTTVINASTVRPYCPGLNCTFPRYTTLGICHQCADISSSIKSVCDSKPIIQDNIIHPRCKWSLPSGQFIQYHHDFNTETKLYNAKNFAVLNSTTTMVKLSHVPGTFTNVTLLAYISNDPGCTIYNDSCRRQPGVPTVEFETLAVECALFPCARTYTASVINGAVVETEVKRSFAQDNFDKHPRPVKINPNEDCKITRTMSNVGPLPCTYVAGPSFIISLGIFFWGFWNGTVTGTVFEGALPSNDILEILYGGGFTNFTHIDRILSGIANSTTAAIRLTGDVVNSDETLWGGQGNITGQVMMAGTCIEVRWGWIAVPVAVVLLTLLLLVFTVMFGKATQDPPAWKSSALPSLFHGFDTAKFASTPQLLTATEMEKEASSLWVKLTDEENGILRLELDKRQVGDDLKLFSKKKNQVTSRDC